MLCLIQNTASATAKHKSLADICAGGGRSFASSSTNFQDLAHLADIGASMSSGTDVALQEVLEELSVPARRALLRPRLLQEQALIAAVPGCASQPALTERCRERWRSAGALRGLPYQTPGCQACRLFDVAG